MQTLVLIRRILEVLGLCLKSSDQPNYGRFTNYTIVALLTGFLMITVEFILTHSDDTADALYGIMQFVTFFTVWTCYICFANQKHLTFEFLTNLQEIVDGYEKKHGHNGIYDEAERKSHGIAKWPIIIFFAAFYGVIIISVVDIIISDFVPGELHPGEWYTFYKMTAPFDRNSVFGFIIYFIIQFLLLHCYYAGLFPCFSFFLGICYYLKACCDDLGGQFKNIDYRSSRYSELQIRSKLIMIVLFHIKIIQIFELSTEIFSGVIFFQLACGSGFQATTLFQLDLAWGNFDGNFFVIVCVVFLSIMCILPYCWFASVLSLQLVEISDFAYNSLWYVHPPYLQIYMKWIIMYGQIPRNYDGYNIFKCSLEVFTKISKASGSYYLMLKNVK